MNALILAAGLGTRLKPVTDYIPKALFPINGKPLLQHIIEKLSVSTTDGTPPSIVVNTYHHAEQIINFIRITREAWNASITVSDERPNLLDTGGAIKGNKIDLFLTSESACRKFGRRTVNVYVIG